MVRQRGMKRSCVFLPAGATFEDLVWRPAVDVYRTPGGWLAKFDLAGVQLEDVHVDVTGRCLAVHGVRRDWLIESGCQYHSLEIAYSRFERTIEFPVEIAHATMRTEYHLGMLLVWIETEGK